MPLQEGASKDAPWKQELPGELELLARESRAFQRARLIKSADELLELVLLYSMADLSLREVAGVWAGRGTPLSDEAVRQRLAACPQWMAGLVRKLFPVRAFSQSGGRQWRLVICDGSSIRGPGSTGTDYRWHMAYEPGTQQVAEVQLSDVHTGESLTHYQLGPGVVVLGDRNFAKAPALVAAHAQGAHLVIRMTPQYLKLWTRKGVAFDLGAALRAARGRQRLSFAVQVREERSGQAIAVWVHAHHLTEQQINRARRRVKRQAARNGRTPRAQTLWLSEWVLVLTTLPPEELSAEVILELYRVRWQVELVIKRYKSLLAAARVRAKRGSPLAEVYLLGKLVFALLVERRAMARLGTEWTQMLHARQATWWRVWQLLAQEWVATLLNPVTWSEWDWPAVLRVLAERPRKRELQVVPAAVVQWLKTRLLRGPLPQAA
jgi:Transposase DDE domain